VGERSEVAKNRIRESPGETSIREAGDNLRAARGFDKAARAGASARQRDDDGPHPARAAESDAGDRSPQQWPAGANAAKVAAFCQGLREIGYVEGQNLAIEYRWAEGHYNRLPALAAELVGRKVDVIVAMAGTPSALAATNETSTIPIIVLIGFSSIYQNRILGQKISLF
jgi:ABC transporter substrate binding protein